MEVKYVKSSLFLYLNRIHTATFLPFIAYNTDNQLITDTMLEIRQDMCGHSSKITKDDILFNLMQSRDEMNKYYASL